MSDEFITDVTQWQGVDDVPIAGSDNMVKSGGVFKVNLQIQKGVKKIEIPIFKEGYYINLGQTAIGDVVPVNAPTEGEGNSYSLIPVQEGDILTINGTGAAKARLYGFIDDSDHLLKVSSANLTAENLVVYAPTDSAYAIINHTESPIESCYIQSSDNVSEALGNLKKDTFVAGIPVSIDYSDYEKEHIGISSGAWAIISRTTQFIPILAGQKLHYKNDSSYNVIYGILKSFAHIVGDSIDWATGWSATAQFKSNSEGIINIPVDGNYLYMVETDSQGTSIIDGLTIDIRHSNTTLPEEIGAVKEDIISIQGVTKAIGDVIPIVFTDHQRISCQLGQTVDFANPETTGKALNFQYAVADCSEGDVFSISVLGGTSNYYAWSTVNSENVVVRVSEAGEIHDAIVTILEGEAKIIIHNQMVNTNAACFKGITNFAVLQEEIDDLQEQINDITFVDNWNLNDYNVGVDNEIYTMWNYPQLIECNNYKNKLFWGWCDNNGISGVGEYDINCKTIKRVSLKKINDKDDHNNVTVFELADGKILAGYSGGHQVDNKEHFRISNEIESLDGLFGNEVTCIGSSEGDISYNQTFFYNDLYYIFFRDTLKNWAYITTADFETFSQPKKIISAPVQYYIKLVKVSDNSNLLRIAMYSNPGYKEYCDIRGGFIDLSNGNILNTDGTTILGSINDGVPVSYDSFTVLVNRGAGENDKLRLWDIALSPKNTFIVAYSTMSTSIDGRYYVYNSLVGSSFDLGAAGTIFLSNTQCGIAFVDSNTVVLIKRSNSTYSFTVELWKYANSAWSQYKVIFTDNTTDAPVHLFNMRPIVSDKGNYIIWQRGWLESYDSGAFCTNLKLYDVANDEILF